jgi:phage-related protein (TIGR01555 family)
MGKPRHVKTVSAALARTNSPLPEPSHAADAALKRVQAADALVNVVAGLGTDRDKSTFTDYAIPYTLTRIQLENIFRQSWVGKRICKAVPEDMTREWIETSWDGQDDDPKGVKALAKTVSDFHVIHKFRMAQTWANLYGGCAIIMGIKGDESPAKMSQPLEVDKLKKDCLRYLHVLDRWRIGASASLVTDIEDPEFGAPSHYILAESGIMVHRSRLLLFHGQELPYFLWRANAMWHDSELQHVYDNLRNYDTSTRAIATMLFEQNIDIMSGSGLADLLSSNEGSALVAKRYLGMATMKSLNRMIVIDKDEETYDRKQNTFSGIDKLIEKFMLDLSGAADIPLTRLFGQSPAGLSATGESDMRNYYDRVKAAQEAKFRGPIEKLYPVLCLSTFGKPVEDFHVDFKPLWQMTDTEKSAIELNEANRDHIRLDDGVVTEGLLARELKSKRTYSMMEDKDVQLAEKLALQPKVDPDVLASIPKTPPFVDNPGKGAAGIQGLKKPVVPAQPQPKGKLPGEKPVDSENTAKDANPDQPQDHAGRWAENGGTIGTTASGKPIVAPPRIKGFLAGGGGSSTPRGPSVACEHVATHAGDFTPQDHRDAHRMLLDAAKKALEREDLDRAGHLGAVAHVHRHLAREAG